MNEHLSTPQGRDIVTRPTHKLRDLIYIIMNTYESRRDNT